VCFCPGVCFCPNIGTRKNYSSLEKCIFLSSAVFELYTRACRGDVPILRALFALLCHSSSRGLDAAFSRRLKDLKYFRSALQISYQTDVIFVYKFTSTYNQRSVRVKSRLDRVELRLESPFFSDSTRLECCRGQPTYSSLWDSSRPANMYLSTADQNC